MSSDRRNKAISMCDGYAMGGLTRPEGYSRKPTGGYPIEDGSGGGLGRLEKADAYAKGGRVKMPKPGKMSQPQKVVLTPAPNLPPMSAPVPTEVMPSSGNGSLSRGGRAKRKSR